MNTNMTEFRWFPKYLPPHAMDESSLSIGRVKEVLAEMRRIRKRSVISGGPA